MRNHTKVLVSEKPKCDFCNKAAEYDFKMQIGTWAHGCEKHFKEFGIKLCLGYGQKLIEEDK